MKSVTKIVSGRVNLLGEHTDYNGGMVMPACLSVTLQLQMALRSDKRVRIAAEGFVDCADRSLADEPQGHWSDVALGAMREAHSLGQIQGGADLVISSTIPAGAGLSSSAALTVAILKAARDIAQSKMSDVDIALAAQRVEHEYIGVPCGIMDQMVVSVGHPKQVIALDTASLEYSKIDLPIDHAIAVVHSGFSRKLSDGRYKARKEECDQARAAFSATKLCLLDPDYIRNSDGIEPILKRRAMHCATEHRRVLSGRNALRCEDALQFGELMNESHISMRDDFQMSLPEIDALVDSACDLGATGARLTGGGFGGCIVSLVPRERTAVWVESLLAKHPRASLIDVI